MPLLRVAVGFALIGACATGALSLESSANEAKPALAQIAAPTADFDGLMAQAVAARRAGDFPVAEAHVRRALALRPGDAEARSLLGHVLVFQQRFDEALVELETARRAVPADRDIQLAIARVRSYRGEYAQAEAVADDVLKQEPDNVGAIGLKARLAYYQKRYTDSEALFRRARSLAPRDLEAVIGLGDVRAAAGDRAGAMALYREAETIDSGSADVKMRIEQAGATGGTPWRLDMGHTASFFERQGRSNWHESFVQLARRLDEATSVRGRVERDLRFDNVDTFLQAGIDRRFSEWLTGYAEIGGSPNTDFLAVWSAAAGLGARLWRGDRAIGPTVLTLEGAHAHYRTGNVEKLNPGFEQYFLSGQLWVTAKWINVFDETDRHLDGWLVRADALVTDRMRFYGGLADAPETVQNATVSTRSILGGVIYDVTDRLSMRLDYAHDDRANSYIRHAVGLGLSVKF